LPALESHRHRPNSGLKVTMHAQAMPIFVSITEKSPLGTLSHVLSVEVVDR
jgi:hypothetical protein